MKQKHLFYSIHLFDIKYDSSKNYQHPVKVNIDDIMGNKRGPHYPKFSWQRC